jgi:hypothetical protein
MAKTKYGHFIKKLVYNKLPGGAKSQPEYITWPKGSDLEGLNVSFVWSYHNRVGPWDVGGKYGHVHPYGEVFVFTGLDYDHPNTLGAEMVLSLGEEAEDHIIAAPSVVAIPAGVPHLPMTAKQVDKPYGFLAISVDAEDKTTGLAERKQAYPLVNKCGPMITRMELRDMKRKKGGNADFMAFWTGRNTPGFLLNFTWAFHTGTGLWHEHDPHVHPNDEALVFVGLDPANPDYLGAEIEFRFGEEQEVHVFDTPSVVIAPKGLVHCPLITRRVDKPYAFTAICLAHEHETTWLGGPKPFKSN